MTDTELRFARDELTSTGLTTEQMIGIVDEALRRGEECEEARDWVRKLTRENTLTCVYCGHEYPSGTPSSNAETLDTHIRLCVKHPLYEARERLARLEAALLDIKSKASCVDIQSYQREALQDIWQKARTALEEKL